MHHDTSQKIPSDLLEAAILDAPAGNALPNALLASVSHDLRSPLSVIQGAAEMLLEGFAHLGDDERHAYLGAIRRECLRMNEYIQGLCHFTRLQVGGRAQLARDWSAIDELIGSAVERLRRYRPDARVSVDVASPLRLIRANAPLIEQALFNVLDNAAKFSPGQEPVRVRVAQDAAGRTEIEVADRGPGIAPELRERVFSMFVSADPQARGRNGSGLGLAISRSILRAHGGDVVAEADARVGARIRVWLPAGVPPPTEDPQ